MQKKQIMLQVCLWLLLGQSTAQNSYHTQPLNDEIKTLLVIAGDNAFAPPVITKGSNELITLYFDKLSLEEPRLRYRLIHCSADWQKDNLSEIEYLDGFNDQLIENYRFSQNTTVGYVHYSLSLPNDQVRPKVSGNYAAEVYYENYPDEPLLQACFSVVEPRVSIKAEVSGNTDIDIHRSHQQLRLEIDHAALSLRDPLNEIIVTVSQNNRPDNRRPHVKPTFVNPNRLIYDHNRDLIFEAGNEYRRMEIISKRFGGMNVDRVYYEKPNFHAILQPDVPRADHTWQYDKDQNGRFFIKNTDAYEPDVEADYFMVHFVLIPFPGKEASERLFLNGNFTYNNHENYELKFDRISGTYQQAVLLKQGAYNYQYLTSSPVGLTVAKTEGNYYETNNEYMIMVYHRASGSRYDKLIGWKKIEMNTR